MKICRKCPIFKDVLGGICNSKLWLNPDTNEVSTEPKPGFFVGATVDFLPRQEFHMRYV